MDPDILNGNVFTSADFIVDVSIKEDSSITDFYSGWGGSINKKDEPSWSMDNASEILEATRLFEEYKEKGILILHKNHENVYLRNLIAWHLEGIG